MAKREKKYNQKYKKEWEIDVEFKGNINWSKAKI